MSLGWMSGAVSTMRLSARTQWAPEQRQAARAFLARVHNLCPPVGDPDIALPELVRIACGGRGYIAQILQETFCTELMRNSELHFVRRDSGMLAWWCIRADSAGDVQAMHFPICPCTQWQSKWWRCERDFGRADDQAAIAASHCQCLIGW